MNAYEQVHFSPERSSKPLAKTDLMHWRPSLAADDRPSLPKNNAVLLSRRRCVLRICWSDRFTASRCQAPQYLIEQVIVESIGIETIRSTFGGPSTSVVHWPFVSRRSHIPSCRPSRSSTGDVHSTTRRTTLVGILR